MDPLVDLARVYADAEHALNRRVAAEVTRTLDTDGPTDLMQQAAAVARLRRDAQAVVRHVNGQVPPIARRGSVSRPRELISTRPTRKNAPTPSMRQPAYLPADPLVRR